MDKLINKMTVEEIMNTSEEDRHTLYVMECLDRGVPFKKEPSPVKPVDPVEGIAKVRLYAVGDLAVFKSIEDATELVNKAIELGAMTSGGWSFSDKLSQYRKLGPDDRKAEIKAMNVYDDAGEDEVAVATAKYKEELEAFEVRKKEHEKYTKEQNQVQQYIDDIVYFIIRYKTRYENLKAIYEEYAKVQPGAEPIVVWSFFDKAYSSQLNELHMRDLPFDPEDYDIAAFNDLDIFYDKLHYECTGKHVPRCAPSES